MDCLLQKKKKKKKYFGDFFQPERKQNWINLFFQKDKPRLMRFKSNFYTQILFSFSLSLSYFISFKALTFLSAHHLLSSSATTKSAKEVGKYQGQTMELFSGRRRMLGLCWKVVADNFSCKSSPKFWQYWGLPCLENTLFKIKSAFVISLKSLTLKSTQWFAVLFVSFFSLKSTKPSGFKIHISPGS